MFNSVRHLFQAAPATIRQSGATIFLRHFPMHPALYARVTSFMRRTGLAGAIEVESYGIVRIMVEGPHDTIQGLLNDIDAIPGFDAPLETDMQWTPFKNAYRGFTVGLFQADAPLKSGNYAN